MIDLNKIDHSIVAAATAALGAIVVKLLERWAAKRSDNFSEGEKLRNELRSENIKLKEELDKLRDELSEIQSESDTWRRKYWKVIEKETSDKHLISILEKEVRDLKNDIIQLNKMKLLE